MIGKKMQDSYNTHIQAEIDSAYLYLAMAVQCDAQNFKGFAHWLRLQHHEEMAHAYKMIDYLLERGGKVVLKTIAAPPTEFGTPLQVFEQVYEHEQAVTKRIHDLYENAVSKKDVATQVFLQWFVSEQVEEEANASEVVEKIRFLGDKASSLLYLDKEMKKRVAG
jgi:ferritin